MRTLVDLARTYGIRGLVRRAAHEVLLRTRAYQAITPQPAPPSGFEPLPLDVAGVRSVWARHPEVVPGVIAAADAMLAGRYPFFSKVVLDIGWPPPWHRHPRSGRIWDAAAHWTLVDHGGSEGDIKWIWEPHRFAFAWLLPRAFVASGDRRYATEFHRAVHDWAEANPPYRGAAWSCAQETSLRAIALVFAASALRTIDPLVERILHDSARRIAATLHYALSQRNNHAISEAVGLWTLAVTCPAWPQSARWQAAAARALREAIRDQFARDGAYIQESINYHRLAVHLLLWARWVSRSRSAPLPEEVDRALTGSLDLLAGLLPVAGGEVPNHGHDDGSLLLALSGCDYADLRPTIQHLAFDTRRPTVPPGPWDEPAAWFGLAAADPVRKVPDAMRVTSSGYITSVRGDWMLFSRVACHRDHRPGHADALHVDVWRGSENLALDPGTFAYSEPPPWDNRLVETRVHNTCSVGSRSQSRRRGRFLWTHWSCASLVERAEHVWLAKVGATWDGTHAHWRLVAHGEGAIDVLDRIVGATPAALRVHWNLLGTGWRRDGARWSREGVEVSIAGPSGAIVRDVRGDDASELGWASRGYGHRQPCTAVELEVEAATAWFHTRIGPAGPSIAPEILDVWRHGDTRKAFHALLDKPVPRDA